MKNPKTELFCKSNLFLTKFETFLILTFLFITVNKTNAQPPIPATLPETVVTGLSIANPGDQDVIVNCDMYELSSRSNIKAIAWDNGALKNYTPPQIPVLPAAWFYVEDGSGHSQIVTLPQYALQPDIVIADDRQNPGRDYLVGVVYCRAVIPIITPNMMGDAYFSVYRLNNVGLPSFSVSPVATQQLTSGGNIIIGMRDGNPHIDMWSEQNTLVNGKPMLTRYAIVFSENYGLNGRYGDISNIAGFTPFSIGACSGFADVACLTDISNGQAEMEIVYGSAFAGGNLKLAEYNILLGSLTTSVLDNHESIINRIEAMSLYDPAGDGIKWQVAASILQSAVPAQAYGYNDKYGVIHLSNNPLFNSIPNLSPAVAAGIGMLFSNIGNQQYTLGFYPDDFPNWMSYDKLISRSIQAVSGSVSADYEVNINSVYSKWDVNKIYAVSNCSNSGKDILSAYFNGGQIVYKVSPNAMLYKTIRIDGNSSSGEPVGLYPNPVYDLLYIKGGSSYAIYDMTGRVVSSGSPSHEGVNVARLAVGLYAVKVIDEDGKAITLKFTKQ